MFMRAATKETRYSGGLLEGKETEWVDKQDKNMWSLCTWLLSSVLRAVEVFCWVHRLRCFSSDDDGRTALDLVIRILWM
jgi:hypothetical protein